MGLIVLALDIFIALLMELGMVKGADVDGETVLAQVLGLEMDLGLEMGKVVAHFILLFAPFQLYILMKMNSLIDTTLINKFEDLGAGELMQKFNAVQGYSNGHGYGTGEGFGYGDGDGDGDGDGEGEGKGSGCGSGSRWESGWGGGVVTGHGDGAGSGKD